MPPLIGCEHAIINSWIPCSVGSLSVSIRLAVNILSSNKNSQASKESV